MPPTSGPLRSPRRQSSEGNGPQEASYPTTSLWMMVEVAKGTDWAAGEIRTSVPEICRTPEPKGEAAAGAATRALIRIAPRARAVCFRNPSASPL